MQTKTMKSTQDYGLDNLFGGILSNVKQIELNTLEIKRELAKLKAENLSIKSNLKSIEKTANSALEKVTFSEQTTFTEEWLTQQQLGNTFEPIISSHDIGKLLVVLGLSKKKTEEPIPYQHCLTHGYAKRGHLQSKQSYYWNKDIFMKRLKNYLTDINEYETFLKIKTIRDMKNFIKQL